LRIKVANQSCESKIIVYLGIFGALQFLVLTAYAMWIYPGGTIHERGLESYSFLTNYFSDLGRTTNFRREPNTACHNIFKTTLTISGVCIMLFFSILPSFFKQETAKIFAYCALFCGMVAGACYIGIGWIAWNENYWGHIFFVTRGFIAFLIMSGFYAIAIFLDKNYPNKYGMVLISEIFVLLYQSFGMLKMLEKEKSIQA